VSSVSTPFDSSKILVMNSIRDEQKMTIVYQFKNNRQRRMQQKSYFFINQLLGHEGKGSLYQSLKQLNLVEELCTEELGGYKTILDLISIEITLTLEGM
jgi:secreted Zn-dependent insulinase-like peptidase